MKPITHLLPRPGIYAGLLIACAMLAVSSVAAAERPTDKAPVDPKLINAEHGIQIMGLRSSARGYIIDFRYKVLDIEKAAQIHGRDHKPYLIDQATGKRLTVPNMPKAGPLRQTSQRLVPGKVYFALFANPGQVVKSGSKVTIVIGDYQAKDLVVE